MEVKQSVAQMARHFALTRSRFAERACLNRARRNTLLNAHVKKVVFKIDILKTTCYIRIRNGIECGIRRVCLRTNWRRG